MANKVLLKKSSVGAKTPLITDLAYGELAINYADGRLYYKTSSDVIDSFPSLTSTATLTNKTLTTPVVDRIDWLASGTGAPTTTTRSSGTKLTLYPALDSSYVDYAIGIDAGTLWSSLPAYDNGQYFKWYGGTTEIASLSGQGTFTTSNIKLNAQGELRLADADSSNYVGFKSPSTVASNLVWTLPSTDGTTGQHLSTNGSGVLSWADAGSGGGGGYSGLVEISQTGITTSTTLYSASATTYRGAKYTIQITNSTAYAMYEFVVMHDGTSVYFPYSSTAYAADANNNYQSFFSGDYLDTLATLKIQVGDTYHALNWAVTGGNLVFSASCSSGTISVKGTALLIKA